MYIEKMRHQCATLSNTLSDTKVLRKILFIFLICQNLQACGVFSSADGAKLGDPRASRVSAPDIP